MNQLQHDGNSLMYLKSTRLWAFYDEMPSDTLHLGSRYTIREFMTDSGASQHIMDWNMLTDEEKETIRELDDPIPLRTATQIIWIKHCVDIWIKELAVRAVACAAPHGDSPCVLSLGRSLGETGYDSHWYHGGTPYSQHQQTTVYCQVNRDCPFYAL